MALSIKTEEADRPVCDLAAATGESLTVAVPTALRERLSRVRVDRQASIDRRRRLGEEFAGHRVLDRRTPDEIIGCDGHGIPW